jgi:acyl-lipid omega-6 desaturase (Delta-12 desaturase)
MRRTFAELVTATRPYAVEDKAKSWRLLFFTCAVAGVFWAGTLIPESLPLRGVFSILLGLTTVRIFIFYHDYLHGAIFRGSSTAAPIMKAFGILVLNPPNAWRRTHNYHHEHNSQIATASIGSFPIMTVEQYKSCSLAQKLKYRAARFPGTILIGYITIFLMGMCGKSYYKDPSRHRDSLVSLVIHGLLIFMFAHFGVDVLLLSYILPLSVACMVGAYLFYIQHNFPDVFLRPRTEWDYVGAALDSSSMMDASWLGHWFTGNIGYHHVHHLNPTIPFYRLPEAMAAIPELQNPRRTSLKPLEIFRCLRLKLWDPQAHAMVGWNGSDFQTQQNPRNSLA